MTVAVVDYGSGNLRSASKAIGRAAVASGYARATVVTSDPKVVRAADRVVLPGVGAFASCYRGLTALPGMVEALHHVVCERGRPFLGICVGMQLFAEVGYEHGSQQGLGWIRGEVVPITPSRHLKIPHMGWNELHFTAPAHALAAGLPRAAHAYFVHSYHFVPRDPLSILATVEYGGTLVAAIGRENMVGTQFHPEKSQAVGLRILSNFLAWRP